MIRRFPEELEHRRVFSVIWKSRVDGKTMFTHELTLPEAKQAAKDMDGDIFIQAFSPRELKAIKQEPSE